MGEENANGKNVLNKIKQTLFLLFITLYAVYNEIRSKENEKVEKMVIYSSYSNKF